MYGLLNSFCCINIHGSAISPNLLICYRYNFVEKINGITLLSEIPGGSQVVDSYNIIVAPNQLDVPSVEGLVIPEGTCGQILKVIEANVALVRWEVIFLFIIIALYL